MGVPTGGARRRPERIAADLDADRYYRAAFDHDNHDCAIHANEGQYRGAATRLLQWHEPDDDEYGPVKQARR